MTTFLPDDVRESLAAARIQGLKKASRHSVQVGDQSFPVLSLWENGFSVDASDMPPLRGLVDLYEGSTHKAQCLIVASDEEDGLTRYEFKRATSATANAPLDFYRDPEAPTALIGNG